MGEDREVLWGTEQWRGRGGVGSPSGLRLRRRRGQTGGASTSLRLGTGSRASRLPGRCCACLQQDLIHGRELWGRQEDLGHPGATSAVLSLSPVWTGVCSSLPSLTLPPVSLRRASDSREGRSAGAMDQRIAARRAQAVRLSRPTRPLVPRTPVRPRFCILAGRQRGGKISAHPPCPCRLSGPGGKRMPTGA